MIVQLSYLICAILFIVAIYKMSSPVTARLGNFLALSSVLFAVIICLLFTINTNVLLILSVLFLGLLCGIIFAYKIKITNLPQMVAILNGAGGFASALIVMCGLLGNLYSNFFINILGLIIGLLTFSGSFTAFAKIQGSLNGVVTPAKWGILFCFALTIILIVGTFFGYCSFLWLIIPTILLGICITLPIGGADMPVLISVLNSLSGWSAVLVGLALNDLLLIIAGTLVGASGSILSIIMCKAMNRSFVKILWPDNNAKSIENKDNSQKSIKQGTPIEASYLLSIAQKVIIVPGFGMASSQAQNILKVLAVTLKDKYRIEVKFAIHPVAGRMPGHMNVLLAEAGIDYDDVFEMNDINHEFETADVAYVIGANDITNPSAKTDKNSPLYGMPILEVEKARTVFFVKRSMAQGYSKVDNPLFFAPNTIMLFGDAKKVTEEIIKNL